MQNHAVETALIPRLCLRLRDLPQANGGQTTAHQRHVGPPLLDRDILREQQHAQNFLAANVLVRQAPRQDLNRRASGLIGLLDRAVDWSRLRLGLSGARS